MQYMLLIYNDEQASAALPAEDRQVRHVAYGSYTEMIKNSGVWVGGEALHPTDAATTVRVRNGKINTTDGPFAETHEQLGGYYVINAKDLDEAISLAAKIPDASKGSIEVRPILTFN
jgi:hypothetical protein